MPGHLRGVRDVMLDELSPDGSYGHEVGVGPVQGFFCACLYAIYVSGISGMFHGFRTAGVFFNEGF